MLWFDAFMKWSLFNKSGTIDELKYRIAGKFGEEFNLVVWRINRPTTKLKSANIKL